MFVVIKFLLLIFLHMCNLIHTKLYCLYYLFTNIMIKNSKDIDLYELI